MDAVATTKSPEKSYFEGQSFANGLQNCVFLPQTSINNFGDDLLHDLPAGLCLRFVGAIG